MEITIEKPLPLPEHISARAKDLPSLLEGLLETNTLLHQAGYNPVLAATTIAFGFAFIHPLTDGNGRIHRYIIHHILTKMGHTKRGMIFPISSAILNRIDEYQEILDFFSSSRVDLIQWKETLDHNVDIVKITPSKKVAFGCPQRELYGQKSNRCCSFSILRSSFS